MAPRGRSSAAETGIGWRSQAPRPAPKLRHRLTDRRWRWPFHWIDPVPTRTWFGDWCLATSAWRKTKQPDELRQGASINVVAKPRSTPISVLIAAPASADD